MARISFPSYVSTIPHQRFPLSMRTLPISTCKSSIQTEVAEIVNNVIMQSLTRRNGKFKGFFRLPIFFQQDITLFYRKISTLSFNYRPPFPHSTNCLACVSFNSARQLEKRSFLSGFHSSKSIYLAINLAAGLRSSAGVLAKQVSRIHTIAGFQ